MYKIIGADSKEYGPVEAEVLRQWYGQGRVNAQTLIRPEGGGEWQPMSAFPEFADVFGAASAAQSAPAVPAMGVSSEMLNADYDLDIGGCVGEAWNAFSRNFGLVLGGAAIFILIQGGMSGLAQIPILGFLILPVMLVVTGPLMGGLYYFLLKNIRREPVEIGDLFCGFKVGFGQLILGHVVTSLLIMAAALPGLVLAGIGTVLMMKSQNHSSPLYWALIVAGTLLVLLPVIYLGVSWVFTLPLIIDKRMDFWSAMGASRRKVGQHWWTVFGLSVVAGLIHLAGMIACCIGLFFTLPIGMGSFMAAYQRMFDVRSSTAPFGPPS